MLGDGVIVTLSSVFQYKSELVKRGSEYKLLGYIMQTNERFVCKMYVLAAVQKELTGIVE